MTDESKVAEALEEKLPQLQEWEQKLALAEGEISKKQQALQIREAQVSSREKTLAEHEKTLDGLTADLSSREEKIRVAQAETERLAHELEVQQREFELQAAALKERQDKLEEMQRQLSTREHRAQVELAERQAAALEEEWKKLNDIRQQTIQKLEAELAEMRTAAEKEADGRRAELKAELEKVRETAEADIKKRRAELDAQESELAQQQAAALDSERKTLKELRQRETEKLDAELAEMRNAAEEEISRRRSESDKIEQELRDFQVQLEGEKKSLEFDRARLKKLEDTIQEQRDNLDGEVEEKISDRVQSFESQLQTAREENDRLRQELSAKEKKLNSYATFQILYGSTPEILQQKMQDLQHAYENLKVELGRRPGEEVQQECSQLKTERDRLQQELSNLRTQTGNLQQQTVEVDKLRNENTILRASNDVLNDSLIQKDDIITRQDAQIKRLMAAEITPAEREKRMDSLRVSYLGEHAFNAPPIAQENIQGVDEIEWLEKINDACRRYGISFPRRVLYAFHTAFKIANWSTITVLAGVSGTGKSELPRLYSAFGGFNFIPVAVQPNWDSQESMLGFFNSIDNKFDAQPVLRFLYECTENFDNNMAIVLLDEMNLAHVEHYFADFLSKLETRRSSPENNLPQVYVNLGAGVEPYGLRLKRNILWCGTMNQDETTKSLSDKVLDRGIVINFPRPRELKGRKGAMNLDHFCRNIGVSPMSTALWNSWRVTSVQFEGKQLEKLIEYRRLLEEMNNYLSHAGRAIGHRVWQSIEHYVINYPTVRAEFNKTPAGELPSEMEEAIHIAVEDQIVQKVMPKLRGIDTRGKSRENCLEPIKELLNRAQFNLDNDFDRACEMGYGQFMWGSAEYIEDDEAKNEGGDNAAD